MKKYERYIDRFFDEENYENVKLEDNDGKEIEFEQVAVIDYEEKYYAILHPVTKLDGVNDDEALVFMIDEENDCLVYCEDEATSQAVFAVFYDSLEDEEQWRSHSEICLRQAKFSKLSEIPIGSEIRIAS